MKLTMLTRACGDFVNAAPGETIDVTQKRAKELIAAGFAVDTVAEEKAAAKAAEEKAAEDAE